MAIRVDQCDERDELFTYHQVEGDRYFTWNVTRMRLWLPTSATPIIDIDINVEYAKFMLVGRNVDEQYARSLPLERLNTPIIMVKFNESGGPSIDGHHRHVARWLMGLPTVPAYFLPLKAARAFLVTGIAREYQRSILSDQEDREGFVPSSYTVR